MGSCQVTQAAVFVREGHEGHVHTCGGPPDHDGAEHHCPECDQWWVKRDG